MAPMRRAGVPGIAGSMPARMAWREPEGVPMTSHGDFDLPRRPLRVRFTSHALTPGAVVDTQGFHVVRCGDPTYEREYHRAAYASRWHGTPMPYDDASGD